MSLCLLSVLSEAVQAEAQPLFPVHVPSLAITQRAGHRNALYPVFYTQPDSLPASQTASQPARALEVCLDAGHLKE